MAVTGSRLEFTVDRTIFKLPVDSYEADGQDLWENIMWGHGLTKPVARRS